MRSIVLKITGLMIAIAAAAEIPAAEPGTREGAPATAKPVLQLTSEPTIVEANSASKTCPFSQRLVLTETAGRSSITLKSFLVGTFDLSTMIKAFWTTDTLPAGGQLAADLCFANLSVPVIFGYKVSGSDAMGNDVSVWTQTAILDAAQSAGKLSVVPVGVDIGGTTATLHIDTGGASIWTLHPGSPAAISWLRLSATSGSGATDVTVQAADQTPTGTYMDTLVVECVSCMPQLTRVPVKLTVK